MVVRKKGVKPMKERPFLATGEVAKVAGISKRKVAQWIDSGLLRGFTIPGSKHRRVRRDDLEAFLKKHGMAPA